VETRLADWARESPDGANAESILRACVHCGFCLATCPTYQVLGDELDSPRGRIYQIKQVLEGAPATRETQLHLDRCLTCRSCETTCPSGVQYGQLVDIGRAAVDARVVRPLPERIFRWLLREGVSRPGLFGAALRLGRLVKWALPAGLQSKVASYRPAGRWPARRHDRKVLLVRICAQTALSPSIDAATARVLDRLGIETIPADGAGCCGAIHQHLTDHEGALARVRQNIDAWWPRIESGEVEALIVNASGCGAMVRDYPHLLRNEPAYAARARRVVALLRDPGEFLTPRLLAGAAGATAPQDQADEAAPRIAFHSPCSLQHGLRIRGEVEKLLQSLGARLVPVADGHLCCGSAGTYSLLQPELSRELRSRKLQKLLEHQPQTVLSANIGCIAHLQAGTAIPVRHWLEWLDEVLPPA
jgi:glycolate oxidase iron-sulfur subunit